jgi:hypothetical protein
MPSTVCAAIPRTGWQAAAMTVSSRIRSSSWRPTKWGMSPRMLNIAAGIGRGVGIGG